MIKYIIIAIVGLIEAFGTTINSKFRQKSHKLRSFITAFINIIIWYYLIYLVIQNINNLKLVLIYAVFYATGDVLALYFDNYLEKIAKFRGLKFKKRKSLKRKK
jgi:multidrug transporter EmrE-like cation transporter